MDDTSRTQSVTLAELNALLDASAPARPPRWLADLCRIGDVRDLDDAELCELASESDPRGPQATLAGLLQSLRIRHARDRVTLAVLAAVEHYHLPALIDALGGRDG